MKFFIDTADVNEIREAHALGVLDGVTTNPSLVAKTGRKFIDVLKEICDVVDGPVSAEVVSENAKDMLEEAKPLIKIHKNIVIKVPMTREGLKATHALASDGVGVNVTLIFTAVQGLLAAKAGARFVSPFMGRLDDVATEGMDVVRQLVAMYDNYPDLHTEVLAASVRHPLHVRDAALAGAHVATIPFNVIEQLLKHPLTDIGVAKFLADAKKVPR